MSFNLDDFLHKPQHPALATLDYYHVVKHVVPSINPPHAVLRSVEQLAKGLVFDHLVNVGDTPNNSFLNLAKSGVTSITPYIPYAFLFYNNRTDQASLTGLYQAPEQNVLPSSVNRAITDFHQRVKFDVDFINNNTVKQVAFVEMGIPYAPGLSLAETVQLFKDTFSVFVQYPQLAELYREHGFAGSQVIAQVTTNSYQAWNCSVKLMCIINAFDAENSQQQAQDFANRFTNIWINAIAHVSDIERFEDLQELAATVANDFLRFTFHAYADNIINATPNVNQQLFGLEEFIANNQELVLGLSMDNVADGCLQVPELGELTPPQVLRLACTPGLNSELQTWCIDKWVEYANIFADSDNVFLPDQYYLDILEYGREAYAGAISQARQDYFFALNLHNDSSLMAKLPINLVYTIVNPCILDTSILNLAERQPRALAYYFQLLLDLHNNVFKLLVDPKLLEEQGYVNLYLPAEWLYLCGLISQDLINLAVVLCNQAEVNLTDPEVNACLESLEQKVNGWVDNNFYTEQLQNGEVGLSPRRQVLQSTFVTYMPFDYVRDIMITESESLRPGALMDANVFNLAFDRMSNTAQAQFEQAKATLSPEAYAAQMQARALREEQDAQAVAELEKMPVADDDKAAAGFDFSGLDKFK